MKKTIEDQESIISEYLLGESTYRKLGEKHGVDFRIIHSWVMKYQGKTKKARKVDSSEESGPLPSDVKTLQEELHKSQLHNKLLNAMIDIAEDQLKINIRKKSGARQ